MTVLLSGQTVLLPMFERFPGFEEWGLNVGYVP